MADPIRPKNETNLGGVKFDTNFAQNYGEYKVPHQNAGEFFIDFKNGTKIQYSQQPTDFTAGIFGAKSTQITHYEGKEDYMIFDNVDNLQITDNSKGKLLSLNNCDNVSIDANGDRYNMVSLDNCNDVNIKTSNMPADIWGYDNTNVNIETGRGQDYVHLSDSNNININTNGGDDYISLWDTDNFNVNSGEGNDRVEVKTASEEIYDSREIQLPNGIVIMNEGDELTITKAGDHRFDGAFSETGYVHTIQRMESTVSVKGKGTHNIAQTSTEAFETTLRTETSIQNFDGVETSHTMHEEKLEY